MEMKSPYVEIVAEEEQQSTAVKVAKYAAVLGSLAAVGFIAYSGAIADNTPIGESSRGHTSQSELATIVLKPTVTIYSKMTDVEKFTLFEDFADRFERKYQTDSEKVERFGNFAKFLKLVDERNTMEKKGTDGEHLGAVHGITKFADWDETEFKASFLGYRPPTEIDNSLKLVAKVSKHSGSVSSVNWAGTLTTDVKDQGYCGSCWAFSATEQIESDAIRAGVLTTKDELSPQQIVSCDSKDYGCSGGNTETAYRFVKRNGGLGLSDSYPYTSYYGKTGSCSTNVSNKVNVVSFTSLENESDMKSYVLSTGPLSVCVDASTWSSYKSGIVTSCGTSVDHCVQAVGVNTDDGYWIVRNSWGTSWGESGYIRLALDSNTCAISNDPTYTAIEAV